MGNYHRFARARNLYSWLIAVAAVAVLALTTNLFNNALWLRLPQIRGYGRVRVTPYPEIAAVLLGIAGTIMISPNLATWEASASRRLWPYQTISALTVILLSAATVPLVAFGRARGGGVAPRAEFQAEFRWFVFPYAISTITLVSLAIIVVNYLGPRLGAIAALLLIVGIWLAQVPELGGRLIPLAGPEPTTPWNKYWSFAENLHGRNLPAIIVTAIIAATAAAIISARRTPFQRPDDPE